MIIISKSLAERMASTIRHNRARGKHAVLGMADLVVVLVNKGLSDAEVEKQLGMSADEVLRLKRQSGIPELKQGVSPRECLYSLIGLFTVEHISSSV